MLRDTSLNNEFYALRKRSENEYKVVTVCNIYAVSQLNVLFSTSIKH